MKRELKGKEFRTYWSLTEWINENNIEIVCICSGETSRHQEWVLFYYDID